MHMWDNYNVSLSQYNGLKWMEIARYGYAFPWFSSQRNKSCYGNGPQVSEARLNILFLEIIKQSNFFKEVDIINGLSSFPQNTDIASLPFWSFYIG